MTKAPIKSIDEKNAESAAMKRFSEDAVSAQQKSRNEHQVKRDAKGREFVEEKFNHINRQSKILSK